MAGAGSVQRDQLIFFIYDRRFTLDELQRDFYGDEPMRRTNCCTAARSFMPTSAWLVPGDVGRYPLVEDGGRRGWRGGSPQWEAGRLLLDNITPAAEHRRRRAALVSRGLGASFPCRAISQSSPRTWSGPASLSSEPATSCSTARTCTRSSRRRRYKHRFNSCEPDDVSVAVGFATALNCSVPSDSFARLCAHAPNDADVPHAVSGTHSASSADTRKPPPNCAGAIDAKPDGRRLYLAELFLGREEEVLGRHDESKRSLRAGRGFYPSAQSPRLALSRLARQTGDRASAQRSLRELTSRRDADRRSMVGVLPAARGRRGRVDGYACGRSEGDSVSRTLIVSIVISFSAASSAIAQSANEALFEAARAGDVRAIEAALAAGRECQCDLAV